MPANRQGSADAELSWAPGSCDALVLELHVEARKDLPLGLGRTVVGHRDLRLDEHVEYRLATRNHLPDTETDRDTVAVILEVVGPDRGRAQIGSAAELIEEEGLQGADVDARMSQLPSPSLNGVAKRNQNWLASSSVSVTRPI